MRVLIASPRKSGGAHLRCLLAAAYGLNVAGSRDAPALVAGSDSDAVAAWLAELPEGIVTATDYAFGGELATAAARHDVTLVSIVRHPFDLFLSNYEVAQQRAARKKNTPEDITFWNQFVGLALDDPRMLAYASEGFREEVDWLLGWQASGEATVRFEALSADPTTALLGLEPDFAAITPELASRAVEICPPESLFVSRPFRGRRMGDLPAGAWRERLPTALLDVLRECHADAAEALGYEVW